MHPAKHSTVTNSTCIHLHRTPACPVITGVGFPSRRISTSGDIHWLNQELRAVKTQLGEWANCFWCSLIKLILRTYMHNNHSSIYSLMCGQCGGGMHVYAVDQECIMNTLHGLLMNSLVVYVHVQDSWSYRLHHSSAVLANCRMMQRSVDPTEPSSRETTLNSLHRSGRE